MTMPDVAVIARYAAAVVILVVEAMAATAIFGDAPWGPLVFAVAGTMTAYGFAI